MFQFGLEDDETRQRYQALGRFVQLFAGTEALLQLTLWSAARVSNPIAKAIFAGVRPELAIQHIRRIFEVSDVFADRRSSYDELFQRIGIISEARNLLLHQGISSSDEGPVSTNSWLALTSDRARQIPASLTVLSNLGADTAKVNARLQLNLITQDDVRASIAERSLEHIERPWLYEAPPKAKR